MREDMIDHLVDDLRELVERILFDDPRASSFEFCICRAQCDEVLCVLARNVSVRSGEQLEGDDGLASRQSNPKATTVEPSAADPVDSSTSASTSTS